MDLIAVIGNEGTFSWDNTKPGCFLGATAGTMEGELKDITSLLYHRCGLPHLLQAFTNGELKFIQTRNI